MKTTIGDEKIYVKMCVWSLQRATVALNVICTELSMQALKFRVRGAASALSGSRPWQGVHF